MAGGIWLQWMGWTIWSPLELTWLNGVIMFVVSIFLYDAWFYWGHRLMHWRPLYKHHFWHHRSVAPTVWSNYSDTLADAFAMQSYYLVAPIFLPIPAAVLCLHRLWDHINGQIGHSGFEYFADRTTRFPSPMSILTITTRTFSVSGIVSVEQSTQPTMKRSKCVVKTPTIHQSNS